MYDLEYFEKMLRINSKTAEQICRIRWDWIKEINPKTVLDYGSGVGWFRAHRPPGVDVYTYDIGPFPQTGINLIMYDVVCFWDVLEHIPDFSVIEPVLSLARNVAISIPIIKGELSLSKHYKPQEHLHYFNFRSIETLFVKYGFSLKKTGKPECPPREEVYSFLFRRKM